MLPTAPASGEFRNGPTWAWRPGSRPLHGEVARSWLFISRPSSGDSGHAVGGDGPREAAAPPPPCPAAPRPVCRVSWTRGGAGGEPAGGQGTSASSSPSWPRMVLRPRGHPPGLPPPARGGEAARQEPVAGHASSSSQYGPASGRRQPGVQRNKCVCEGLAHVVLRPRAPGLE